MAKAKTVPAAPAESGTKAIQIPAPDMQTAIFRIVGKSPYCQHKFSSKAREQMKAKQEAGSKANKGKAREPKNFQEAYEGAFHRFKDGSPGIPAPAFRNAMISACRLVGFKMTHAKLSVFVEPDGFDADDGTPLVKIVGKPEKHEGFVRLETGVADIRVRPLWREWSAEVRVEYDRGQFSHEDVANLLARAGLQVGIGEGRPDSRNSAGMGWGTFTLEERKGK